MKKFLLTLIVTMLTAIGAWAQGTLSENPVEIKQMDSKTVTWNHGTSGNYVPVVNFSEGQELVAVNATGGTWGSAVNISITGLEIGEAKFTVSLHEIVWNGSENVPKDEPIITSESIVVNVVDNGIKLTLVSPSPINLDVNSGSLFIDYNIENKPLNSDIRFNYDTSVISVEKASWNGVKNGDFIKITPNVIGSTTLGVELYNTTYGLGHMVFAKSDVIVNVKDKTKAEVLTFADGSTATNIEVAQGYSAKVGVLFETEDAQFTFTPDEKTNGITPTWDKDAKTISFVADVDAIVDATADFTLSSGDKSITVTAKVVAPTPVTEVTITPTEITIAKGETAVFTASTDGADQSVTWSVDDSETIEKVGDGVVRGLKHGIGEFTATSAEDGTISASATVKVTDVLPVEIPKPSEKFYIGDTHSAGLTVPGVDPQYYKDPKYTSSKPSVVSVDEEGNITAHSAGVATLTVEVEPTEEGEAALWTKYTNVVEIVVSKPEYSLTLTPATSAVDLSNSTLEPIQLTPTVLFNGEVATDKVEGTDYQITYALESPFYGVSVDQNGRVTIFYDEDFPMYGLATIVATLTPLNAEGNPSTDVSLGSTAKATVTVTKSDAAATITKLGDGAFSLSIPSAGAFFGEGISENPNVIYVGFEGDDENAPTPIEQFKAATTVYMDGIASNQDIQEFSHLVGGASSTVKNLDMAGLVMSEAVTTTTAGEGSSLYATSHSFLASGDDFYGKKLANVEKLILPRISEENGTLPAAFNAWIGGGLHLNSLVISEGWTVIGVKAFDRGGKANQEGFLNLESLKLPNSLVRIEQEAFKWHQCPTIVFPAKLDYIGESAFYSDPAALKDAFFTGRIAPSYVHKDAFGSANQIANNAYNNPTDGTATRDNYKSTQSGWECMLHYPAGLTPSEKATYEDPTRVYELGDRIATGVDTREATYNYAANSNQYTVTPAWNNPNVALTSLKAGDFGIDPTMEAGFRDLAVGTAYIWPSVQQFRAAYVIAQNGYHWDGTEMSDEEKNRIGLYSFIFTKGDATPNHNEEDFILPYKYEQDLWWTICLPFDMSVEKIQEVFGPDTELCLFSKVIRDTETGKLRLEFKRSVMNDSYAAPADKGTGLKAHTPYMIRPAGTIEETDGNEVFTLDGYRKVKGFEIKEGDAQGFSVVAEDSEGHSLEYMGHPWNYTFIGNYQENYYIPQYSYFLSWSKNNPTHRYFFEQGTTRAFNPYTCVVRAYRGGEDNVVFFDGGKSSSAKFASFFGLADDEATKIEEMEIVCGNRSNDKVYSINGQLINSSVLAPGLYIKNGKKFIVK